jgi:hypothetical protein
VLIVDDFYISYLAIPDGEVSDKDIEVVSIQEVLSELSGDHSHFFNQYLCQLTQLMHFQMLSLAQKLLMRHLLSKR